jgi:hypothetical protein
MDSTIFGQRVSRAVQTHGPGMVPPKAPEWLTMAFQFSAASLSQKESYFKIFCDFSMLATNSSNELNRAEVLMACFPSFDLMPELFDLVATSWHQTISMLFLLVITRRLIRPYLFDVTHDGGHIKRLVFCLLSVIDQSSLHQNSGNRKKIDRTSKVKERQKQRSGTNN